MVFVDISAWFSVTVPNDPNFQSAIDFLAKNREPLVTTDYVIDELLTLLKVRGEFERALAIGRELLDLQGTRVEWVRLDDIRAAWLTFERFRDKAWSFTDCVSLAVMNRLGIQTAFAYDVHFRQFGSVIVVP